jgi:hypothetical protein
MVIRIDGNDYQIPTSLLEITLADRLEYDKTYGRELKEKLAEVILLPEGTDRDFAVVEYKIDLAFKTLSFFGKIPIDLLKDTAIEDVLHIYNTVLESLSFEWSFENPDIQIQTDFEWQGEQWEIMAPELKHTSKATFGEFIDAKQVVKNMMEIEKDNWSALLMLCCVYFRKKEEAYNDAFIVEDGERYKLMQTLPLDYALNVGFFLSATMSSYIKGSRFSTQQEKLESLS